MDKADIAIDLESTYREAALSEALHTRTSIKQLIRDGEVVCIDCEEPIPKQRLAVCPNAARCMDCQDYQETKHGRHHR